MLDLKSYFCQAGTWKNLQHHAMLIAQAQTSIIRTNLQRWLFDTQIQFLFIHKFWKILFFWNF